MVNFKKNEMNLSDIVEWIHNQSPSKLDILQNEVKTRKDILSKVNLRESITEDITNKTAICQALIQDGQLDKTQTIISQIQKQRHQLDSLPSPTSKIFLDSKMI